MPNTITATLLLIFGGLLLFLAVILIFKRVNVQFTKKSPNSQSETTINTNLDWCVFYSSQRGRAKHIAMQTAESFRLSGKRVECFSLSDLTPADLSNTKQCIFIVSTFGSGQAPESSRKFAKKLKKTKLDLSSMHVAILALGDRQYDRFCGFGFTLNKWLSNNNAVEIQPMLTVDQMNQKTISQWHEFIHEQGGDITAFSTPKPNDFDV